MESKLAADSYDILALLEPQLVETSVLVSAAYQFFLGREVDSVGESYFNTAIKNGLTARELMLCLHRSAEGREYRLRNPRTSKLFFLMRNINHPVIGGFAKWWIYKRIDLLRPSGDNMVKDHEGLGKWRNNNGLPKQFATNIVASPAAIKMLKEINALRARRNKGADW